MYEQFFLYVSNIQKKNPHVFVLEIINEKKTLLINKNGKIK